MKRAVGRLLSQAATEPPPFWRPGVLEVTAGEAGLEPVDAFDERWAYTFADDEAVVQHLLAAGGAVYRLENEWHDLVTQIR